MAAQSLRAFIRDIRAAHAARTRYQTDANRLALIAREADEEGYPGIASWYRYRARIATRAARAEYDGHRSGH